MTLTFKGDSEGATLAHHFFLNSFWQVMEGANKNSSRLQIYLVKGPISDLFSGLVGDLHLGNQVRVTLKKLVFPCLGNNHPPQMVTDLVPDLNNRWNSRVLGSFDDSGDNTGRKWGNGEVRISGVITHLQMLNGFFCWSYTNLLLTSWDIQAGGIVMKKVGAFHLNPVKFGQMFQGASC